MGDRFDKLLAMSFHDKAAEIDSQLTDIMHKYDCEFLFDAICMQPWAIISIQAGTTLSLNGSPLHPGCLAFLSHASNANSGYGVYTALNGLLLAGNEKFTIVFKTGTTIEGVTRRMGFHDSVTAADPTDGVFLKQSGTTLNGGTANNTTQSTTETSYTLVANTWYKGVIELNSDATLATFKLYSEDGTLVWSDTLATNIPTAAGRNVGCVDTVSLLSPSTAVVIGSIDYISMVLPNARRV